MLENEWKIIYCNIRGLKSKMTSINDIVSELEPEILLLAETHLKNDVGVRLKGYTYFGRSRTEGSGGGVGIMVKNDIKSRVAPHTIDKDIEMIWISVRRHEERPMFVGVYYGKQESRVSKADIEYEMDLLTEELIERQSEGEILLAMDGNGKIGLLGEPVSRNGKLLLNTFEETDLNIMNKSEKCSGTVTRQNTKKQNEKSAIDFVLCSEEIETMISKIEIDEEGLYKIKGCSDSDHNTILININLKKVASRSDKKRVTWRLNAPEEKWKMFREKLGSIDFGSKLYETSMTNTYTEWLRRIEGVALDSIGKTTQKDNKNIKVSAQVMQLRKEKRDIKNRYRKEGDTTMKEEWRQLYIQKQQEVRLQIEDEKRKKIEGRIDKMVKTNDQTLFWKEKAKLSQTHADNWLITKDEVGKRIFDPDGNRENIASYYEKLYAIMEPIAHPYHDEVVSSTSEHLSSEDYENLEYNRVPMRAEVEEVIKGKKTGKSTTDLKNEMLKRGGIEMTDAIVPLVERFWNEEKVPDQWNHGIITSVWKGKGDKEKLENHRGITVSSSVGTIPEEIINKRLVDIIPFTQFQAGGRKGCSPCDHVFIIRSIISFAMKMRKKIILTFYDVEKAYDRADIADMMHIAWKNGVKGKLWRLARSLNLNLTAHVKTKYGPTRKIIRGGGGKQGGKIIVTLFSKMMDTLSEEMIEDNAMGIEIESEKIANVLFVDDVATMAEGRQQQQLTLDKVYEYALKHKIKWGIHKCKVLEIGRHRNVKESWKLGEDEIQNSETYKYLGDIITRNGINKQNIEERFKKVKNSTREIMSCGSADIMRKIELKACIKLHEAATIPMMLNNCESWNLTQSDKKEMEKMELWALKRILNVPRTTPTAAVRFVTGTLFTEIRIDEKQIIYLQKILQREKTHWTHHMLITLDKHSIGWAYQIREKLVEYGLETDWNVIKEKSRGEWKSDVKSAVEEKNCEKLLSECRATRGDVVYDKTKTKSIVQAIGSGNYSRLKGSLLLNMTRCKAKALVMARYGMLDCGCNFENKYGGKMCDECNVIDDEGHRVNYCPRWSHVNLSSSVTKIDFSLVYSSERDDLESVADVILSIWDLGNGRNGIIMACDMEV